MSQETIMLEPDWGIDFGKPPQLEIRFVEVRDDILYVLGVSHSSIKVGDRFRILRQFEPQANVQDTIGNHLAKLDLRVKSITAYHNQLNRVNADMTAGLELTGKWDNLLPVLEKIGWTQSESAGHQWRDTVTESEKLILTK